MPEGPFENVDYYQFAMAGYFDTMGIPIVAGRGFEAADAAATGLVAVVNETLADTFWKDRNPIGLVAAVACWLPAWRASRVDPTVVLRDE